MDGNLLGEVCMGESLLFIARIVHLRSSVIICQIESIASSSVDVNSLDRPKASHGGGSWLCSE